MARLRTNLIANFVGAGWSTAIQLACVPILIEILGVEGFGLIGFFATLQLTLAMLDLGVSATVSRELARYATTPGRTREARDFLRTLEMGYWAIGMMLGLLVVLLSSHIATHWLNAGALEAPAVQRAIELMGLTIALQWPLRFYQSGLTGLQRQVWLNAIRVLAASVATGGAVAVLLLVSSTVQAFFAWQVVATVFHIALIAYAMWHCVPAAPERPRFNFDTVREALPFATGMSVIVVLGTILAQMDKIVLSKSLSLTEFGQYMTAATVANGLQLFIAPIFSAVFPRFSSLVAGGDHEGVRRLYHAGTQLMAVCVLPTAIVLAVWAPQFLTLWTGNAELAANVAPIATLLLVGMVANGLMNLPYAVQLAYGWTRLNLRLAAWGIVLFAPVLVWAALHYGALGGAATWAAFNVCYLLIGVSLMHRRLLRGDLRTWVLRDIGQPLAALIAAIALIRQVLNGQATGWAGIAELGAAGLAAAGIAVVAAPLVRESVFSGNPKARPLLDQ